MRGVIASLFPIGGKNTIFCIMKSLLATLGLAAARVGRSDEVIFVEVKNTTTSSTVISARVRDVANFSERLTALHAL